MGIEDSPELFVQDLMKARNQKADLKMLQIAAKNSV
jgi:hypothetical protein